MAAALAVTAVVAVGAPEVPDVAAQEPTRPAGPVWGEERLGQTFRVGHPIDRLDVYFGTFARVNTHPVTFRIRRGPGGRDLFRTSVNASLIDDNRYYTFRFDPAVLGPKPVGKEYYFQVDSYSSKPGDAVTVWTNQDPLGYRDGRMYFQGAPVAADLVFRTYYSVGAGSYLGLLLRRLPIDKPAFATPAFFAVLFTVYFVAAGAFAVFAAKRI